MSRDRLAEHRAGRPTPRAQDAAPVELSEISGTPPTENQSFLEEITSIQGLVDHINRNVTNIAELQRQSLDTVDQSRAEDSSQLESILTETRNMSNIVKDRIKALEQSGSQRSAIERNRLLLVHNKFMEVIRYFQRVEQDYRLAVRQRLERQIRIVKPDATPEELSQMVDGGGRQIFAEALISSSRYGESRAAYRAVQERQHDLQRLEQTLIDLTHLFADMGTLIEEQDDTINNIQNVAVDVEADTRKGQEHAEAAVKHARSWRKMRMILLCIVLIAAIVLAIVLGVVFGSRNRGK